ncbi:cell wall hydrolase [Brevundimonas vesicularis]|uniref:cell wall hydrolase n=1 Tax=Brevundimonas vesicularis TaxID=41276 RepID=UPI0038D3FD57
MLKPLLSSLLHKRHRAIAAVPFAVAVTVAVLGLGVAAGSTTRPNLDLVAEHLASVSGGQLNQAGLNAVMARLTPGQVAIARRHDPAFADVNPYGLTPGWESFSLGGKPSLDAVISGLEAQQLNAASPAELDALQPAQPFDLRPATEADRKRALRCLTQAVYYEAALEPGEGQAGVAQVVLNRVRDPNYPSTVCGVVFQGGERVTGCQFSFTCDGSLARVPTAWAWSRAQKVAERALAGHVAAHVGTATHYHADYVRPWWAPSLSKITQVGAHIFYRWKGAAGESAAFADQSLGREPVINEALYAQPRLPVLAAAVTGDNLVNDASGDIGLLSPGNRQIEYEGTMRIVGAPSLGGRRQASLDEIAAINEKLQAFEASARGETEGPAASPPPGVTPMAVEEVGKPAA